MTYKDRCDMFDRERWEACRKPQFYFEDKYDGRTELDLQNEESEDGEGRV